MRRARSAYSAEAARGSGLEQKKYRTPKNPIAREPGMDMVPRDSWRDWFKDQMTTEIMQDPHISNDYKRSLLNAVAEQKYAKADGAINEEWMRRFQLFLLGRYDPRLDQAPPGELQDPLWGNWAVDQLDIPGVLPYLNASVEERFKFESYIEKMRIAGPVTIANGSPTLNSLYLYWKYVLNGAAVPASDFLADWNLALRDVPPNATDAERLRWVGSSRMLTGRARADWDDHRGVTYDRAQDGMWGHNPAVLGTQIVATDTARQGNFQGP